ncbi:hypothetical protein [Prevotella sp.]
MDNLFVKALTDSTDEQMKQKADAQRPKGQRMHRTLLVYSLTYSCLLVQQLCEFHDR